MEFVLRTEWPAMLPYPRVGTVCPYSGLTRENLKTLVLGDSPAVKSIKFHEGRSGRRYIISLSLLSHLVSKHPAFKAANVTLASDGIPVKPRDNKTTENEREEDMTPQTAYTNYDEYPAPGKGKPA